MGSSVFAPFACDIASRVTPETAMRVLEIAAGTGRVTRELCRILPTDASIEATDLNPGMIQLGSEAVSDPRVNWSVADALQLPFEDASFDVAIAQFGVMFYPDKQQGHREAKRVLKPGKPYLFNAWSSLSDNRWAGLIHQTMAELFPDNQPMFFSVPFSYFDEDQIRSDVTAAGFSQVQIEPVTLQLSSPSARELAVGVIEGTPLAASITERGASDLRPYIDAVEAKFIAEFGDKPLQTTMKALVVTAS
jgi:ubiquinone/menaquinone biosynthesis C-methylase UbiE